MSRGEFRESVSVVGHVPEFGEKEIRSEPMIYGGSWDWSAENAGPITLAVMGCIQQSVMSSVSNMALMGYHPVIDTKSVLLMPGQYPCIPGWHCDGVIREARGGQPDVSTLSDPVRHYVCVIGEGTEFARGHYSLDVDESQVWRSVNKQVEKDGPEIFQAGSGEVVTFLRNQLHRGPEAKARGWRYFFRLSFYHMPAANEMRRQVQVYADIGGGW